MIKNWKILNAETDIGLNAIFDRYVHVATRGHMFKISVPVCRNDLKSRFFNARRVSIWNNLPASVVEVDSLEIFKKRLDEHMADMFYNAH